MRKEKAHIGRKEIYMLYLYGMRLRGFSIGCQPNGVKERRDDPTGRYYDIICYQRELSDSEVRDYELDFLGIENP